MTPQGWPGPARPALAALAAERWVMPPDDAACGQAVRSACRAAGFEPDVRWTTDDMLVLARAVGAGHGIAILPRRSVAEDAAAVTVRALGTPQLARRLTAVGRASVLARPAVAAVSSAVSCAVQAAADS